MAKKDQKYRITIRNWDKYQKPLEGEIVGSGEFKRRHWVAISAHLFHDVEFMSLDLCERVAWVGLLCYAAIKGPVFDLSPSFARALWGLYRTPDFKLLEEQGFIDLNTRKEDKEGRKEDKHMSVVAPADAQQVFDYWKKRLDKNARVVFSEKRRRRVRSALKHFTVADLMKAVDGCAKSPFHMGDGPDGTVYDDLELICRDVEHIEKFMAIDDKPPQPRSRGEQIDDYNARAAREFANDDEER